VILFDGDDERTQRSAARITEHERFTAGPHDDAARRPFVLEADDPAHSRDLIEWAEGLEGVRLIQVVYVDFEDELESARR
jgi:hypothetical protein